MFNDEIPTEKVSQVLNHSNITSTLRYIDITKQAVLQTCIVLLEKSL